MKSNCCDVRSISAACKDHVDDRCYELLIPNDGKRRDELRSNIVDVDWITCHFSSVENFPCVVHRAA